MGSVFSLFLISMLFPNARDEYQFKDGFGFFWWGVVVSERRRGPGDYMHLVLQEGVFTAWAARSMTFLSACYSYNCL